MRKKDIEAGFSQAEKMLAGRKGHTLDELDTIGRSIPLRVLKDGTLLGRYCVDNGLSLEDGLVLLKWVGMQLAFLNDVRVVSDISYDEAVRCYDSVRTGMIIIHRVNYIMHECMVSVYDALERDGRLVFAPKAAAKRAEKVWDEYLSAHRKSIERSAWCTLQDHLRIASVAVAPRLEKVYESIRDYMIGLGMRDVEVKARCVVAFLMSKVAGHSFRHFFDDFLKRCGVDYSVCFADDDLSRMVVLFGNLCDTIGVKTGKDEHGYLMMSGFDPEKSQRFVWAWEDFMKSLRDDDLMDRTAQEAIALNPETQKEYEKVIEDEERRQMEESIGQLGGKFKIGSL